MIFRCHNDLLDFWSCYNLTTSDSQLSKVSTNLKNSQLNGVRHLVNSSDCMVTNAMVSGCFNNIGQLLDCSRSVNTQLQYCSD